MTLNGLYKTERIHRRVTTRRGQHVEWEVLKYVGWFNNRRIHESRGDVSSVEFEARYDSNNESERLIVLKVI
ncbi:MAG: IS3 family transposase [Acidimicrobiales bacterium]